jgi:short-subunit dehydrogenase
MEAGSRPLAVVTGASSGIGYELARIFGEMHRQMAEPGSAGEDGK